MHAAHRGTCCRASVCVWKCRKVLLPLSERMEGKDLNLLLDPSLEGRATQTLPLSGQGSYFHSLSFLFFLPTCHQFIIYYSLHVSLVMCSSPWSDESGPSLGLAAVYWLCSNVAGILRERASTSGGPGTCCSLCIDVQLKTVDLFVRVAVYFLKSWSLILN